MFFFFFQAEDGIRDGHVTGVQTCALPISWWLLLVAVPLLIASTVWAYASPVTEIPPGKVLLPTYLAPTRSEERRVGKESRARGTPAHSNDTARNSRDAESECRYNELDKVQ